jgi:glycosyltransferase involved in cell wall biosynthesis
MSRQRLWLVSPCYTDVPAFTVLRKRILEVIDAADPIDLSVRFVLVDDTGDNDTEIDQVRAFDDVIVVSPPFNVGHQRAIVYGLRTIESDLDDDDLVVTMDADGEDRPEDLLRLLAPLIEAPDDRRVLCVARRTKRQESARFKVMYFFFRIMFRILTGVTVRSGNYAAYRGWLARRILRHPYFDLCYSSSLVSLDIPLREVPCSRGQRYAGRSRMNPFRLFMHGLRMLMPFTDRIAVRALAAFTAVFGIGIIAGLAVVAIKVFTTAAIPGWATGTLISILILSFLALGNFVVLFVVFSHSRGISLAGLEGRFDGSTRDPSPPPD